MHGYIILQNLKFNKKVNYCKQTARQHSCHNILGQVLQPQSFGIGLGLTLLKYNPLPHVIIPNLVSLSQMVLV